MLSKGKIKYIRSLQLAKYRKKYQKIVVEGAKIVSEVLAEKSVVIEETYATEGWIDLHKELLKGADAATTVTTPRYIKQMSSLKTPQDVLAVCKMPGWHELIEADLTDWILYLDGIRDPGNLGAIVRVADWFGIRHVCLSDDTVDPYNPKVIQSSMGSLFRVALSVVPLAAVKALGSLQVFVTDMEGRSVFDNEEIDKGILVFGNEAHGVSDRVAALSDQRIAIPADFRLGAESLNAGVAAGIICAALRFG